MKPGNAVFEAVLDEKMERGKMSDGDAAAPLLKMGFLVRGKYVVITSLRARTFPVRVFHI